MLPHTLSNGICSLNAGEDRLALSCIMTVDPKGMVIDHEIAETVIHVDRRMSYTSVAKILEDEDLAEMQEYEELVPMFQRMLELSKILRARRKQRGSIDFDFPETKMILDENGHPIDIKPYDRNVATKIIEDFMLLAKRLLQKIIIGRRCLLYTEYMRLQMMKRSGRWQHLLIILDSLCISGPMKCVRKRFRNYLEK